MGTINIQSTDLSHKAGLTYTGTSDKTIDVDSLVSSTNIKTVNSTSLLGSGDVDVTGIGVNQTWQDVTASRVAGTTYTNTTGKPIVVVIQAVSNSSWGWGISVGGVVVAWEQPSTNGYTHTLVVIVPNGATYLNNASGSGYSINKWIELR